MGIAIGIRSADIDLVAGRLPSLRGIETFVCVAEMLNLRLASERLNVTVSAISYRIQALEDELGLKLFDRSNRRMRLTSEGRAFRDRLQPGLSSLAEATTDVRKTLERPILRVAAPAIVQDLLIIPRLANFLRDYPLTRVELLSGRRRSAGNDVAILPLSPTALREGAEPLLDVIVTPFCSPDFLSRHPISQPSHLLGLPLIDSIPSLGTWQTWFQAAGIEDEPSFSTFVFDNQSILFRAATEGLGVVLGSPPLVQDLVDEGRLVRPLAIECPVTPGLGVIVSERGNVRLAKAFTGWLHRELGSIVEENSTRDSISASES
ncbi:MAG: LysR family transcriptional regulator [Pseudomonadota bacterium]|jgi:LysR family glycine cleavage system transcriptional activator